MTNVSKERPVQVKNGWTLAGLVFLVFVLGLSMIGYFIYDVAPDEQIHGWSSIAVLIGGFLVIGLAIFLCIGFFTLEPNAARVLILFGKYIGSVNESGFHWTNPLNSKPRVSLRSRNFNTATLKVNDKKGNPIEIGAVVVWKVNDTAQALFDVDSYEEYVAVQSEAAVRQLANNYAYDHGEEGEITLRSGMGEVSTSLQYEVQARLNKAGVQVEEARISHLAYAPEIAGAMLKRQQADAIIAARQKIVHGAVTMVEMALAELSERNVIELDDERRAAMIGNLLVILCGDSEAQPVLNTGTLYT